ncbi:hypothetical protein KIN20_015917 [Parelaphostrongylus tenuis]|uniref:Uncharacterized protein n=1 Tax=Parelaphostrongylus tenuis TaxID=148309 RepID=A0AAD5MFP8_PARTN|nr:hypothetical protein KIN20_015917 [Parelaphostrongylus tenuis]
METEVSSNSADPPKTLGRKRMGKAKKHKKLKKRRISKEVEASDDGFDGNGVVDDGDEPDLSGASDSEDFINDESNQQIECDIEAFPMESGDRDGVVNMLTQIFLKADIDLEVFADSIIAQSPFGLVLGPAEDQSDEEDKNVVFGVLTALPLLNNSAEAPKFMKDILDFLEMKSRKFAMKEFRDALDACDV